MDTNITINYIILYVKQQLGNGNVGKIINYIFYRFDSIINTSS